MYNHSDRSNFVYLKSESMSDLLKEGLKREEETKYLESFLGKRNFQNTTIPNTEPISNAVNYCYVSDSNPTTPNNINNNNISILLNNNNFDARKYSLDNSPTSSVSSSISKQNFDRKSSTDNLRSMNESKESDNISTTTSKTSKSKRKGISYIPLEKFTSQNNQSPNKISFETNEFCQFKSGTHETQTSTQELPKENDKRKMRFTICKFE
ncbi:hypothetical protein ABK040_010262 [Willaertia magna]